MGASPMFHSERKPWAGAHATGEWDTVQRRTYYFTGHVQGVGFRYTTRHAVSGTSVTGFVRNLPDGRVELVMEGPDSEMDAVIERVQSDLGHGIRHTTCDESPGTGQFHGFEIRQ